MSVDLREMKVLAGCLTERWVSSSTLDKVKQVVGAHGNELLPWSKMPAVAKALAKELDDEADVYDAIEYLFKLVTPSDDMNIGLPAFKKAFKQARIDQAQAEKARLEKAEPPIHQHLDNAIAALKQADAEMKAAAKLAREANHPVLGGVSVLRDFLSKPISGMEQLKKGKALGMYYSKNY